jgi:hypothetical protein
MASHGSSASVRRDRRHAREPPQQPIPVTPVQPEPPQARATVPRESLPFATARPTSAVQRKRTLSVLCDQLHHVGFRKSAAILQADVSSPIWLRLVLQPVSLLTVVRVSAYFTRLGRCCSTAAKLFRAAVHFLGSWSPAAAAVASMPTTCTLMEPVGLDVTVSARRFRREMSGPKLRRVPSSGARHVRLP